MGRGVYYVIFFHIDPNPFILSSFCMKARSFSEEGAMPAMWELTCRSIGHD